MSQTETMQVGTKPSADHSFEVFPLDLEKPIMQLNPNEERVFHGDCTLICIEGGAELSNPLSENIHIKGNCTESPKGQKKYYLDVMLFRMRTKESGIRFSLQRPKLF